MSKALARALLRQMPQLAEALSQHAGHDLQWLEQDGQAQLVCLQADWLTPEGHPRVVFALKGLEPDPLPRYTRRLLLAQRLAQRYGISLETAESARLAVQQTDEHPPRIVLRLTLGVECITDITLERATLFALVELALDQLDAADEAASLQEEKDGTFAETGRDGPANPA